MNLKDKTVIVTGGAGAIGSNLVKALEKKACRKIIVIDNLSSGYKENIADSEKVIFHKGDINDEGLLNKIFSERIDVIFHLAANFANQSSVDHPVKDLETNGKGTLKLLMRAKENKVERFVYSSSSCVYGNKEGALAEDDTNFDLETPYAITKLLGEHYCRFYHRLYGIKTVIVRYFNSFGPGEMPGRYRNVIPNFIKKALAGEKLTITGTGDETRDFTFVKDIIQGTILAAEKDEAAGQVINLGRGKETKIIDLANMINKLTENKAGVEFKERREWDLITKRLASIEKAEKILGYSPKTELEGGIKETIEWLRKRIN